MASHLASFLSDQWLDDEMINAGSDWILRQLDASHRTDIINCLHIQQLQHVRLVEATYLPRTRLDQLITAQHVDILFLPLHVFGNHWTLLRIDLSDSTYSYADCLYNRTSPPTSTLGLIQWWLTSLLSNTPILQPVPFELELPCQLDGFSCGVIVLDIMAALLLQSPIWEPNRAAVQRMAWFLRLSSDFDTSVMVSHYVSE
jgi:Ulp1 family protease